MGFDLQKMLNYRFVNRVAFTNQMDGMLCFTIHHAHKAKKELIPKLPNVFKENGNIITAEHIQFQRTLTLKTLNGRNRSKRFKEVFRISTGGEEITVGFANGECDFNVLFHISKFSDINIDKITKLKDLKSTEFGFIALNGVEYTKEMHKKMLQPVRKAVKQTGLFKDPKVVVHRFKGMGSVTNNTKEYLLTGVHDLTFFVVFSEGGKSLSYIVGIENPELKCPEEDVIFEEVIDHKLGNVARRFEHYNVMERVEGF